MVSPEVKINVAVIGVGLIGPRHSRTVIKSAEANLVAIVDPISTSAELARELGAIHYSSIQDLLNSKDKPDAAIICTPNHTHVAIAKELVAAGIHILVEKPLSTTVEDGKELLDLTKKTNIKILVGHHRRFNPYTVATKKLLTSGELGDIVAISGLWTSYKPNDYFDPPTEWRRSLAGGVVLINLIHEVDLLHHFFGPIVRVHAEKTPSKRGYEAEEGAALTFRFKSGVVGTFLISDNVPSPYNFESGTGENPLIPKVDNVDFYRIFGTNATLSVPDMMKWSYGKGKKTWHESISQTKVRVGDTVPFELQLAHFVSVIRGEEEPSCSGQAGLAALIVCNAVRDAIESGQTVSIEPYEL
jgi:predicted dehydrogenase